MDADLDIESRYDEDAALSIGDVVAATGVGEATLRAWERRFGFPAPRREPSGHRRYSRIDVERIRAVMRERGRGLSLGVAIDRVTAEPSSPASLFAPLRERRPDLLPVSIRKPQMLHLSRAVEEESAARAERALTIGAFQRPEFYRASERRWRRLARGAGLTFVLASFAAARTPADGPVEVPIGGSEPIADEWAVICLAPGYSACLIGWETVATAGLPDEQRAFDALLSVEPAVVREVAGAAVAIAAASEPEVGERARAYLDRIPDSGRRSQLRLAGAITARAFARMP
ncbi:MAG TPA: DICT sensory domain-containing protein [Solirubrobacterales bacterium]|nr:DICT sensory domain-containing protein [Solirubrobacterales bacterium]